MQPSEDAAKAAPPTIELLRKAAPFVAPHRVPLLGGAALSLVTSALGAVEPLALKLVFDELQGERAIRTLSVAVLLVFGVMLAREALSGLLDMTIWKVRIAVHQSITRATVDRLHALPLSFHKEESVGGLMTKMERGINGSTAAFSDIAFQTVPAVVYLVIAAVVMVKLDVRLSLLVLGFAPVAPLIGAIASREQASRERSLMRRWTKLFARFNEVLGGIAVVKSFAAEEVEKRRFLTGVEEANGIVVRGVRRDATVNIAKNAATVLARAGALALGGWLVLRGEVTLGTLVAFLGYVGAVFGPVQGLTGAYQTLRRGMVSLETIFSILDAHDSLGDAPDASDPGRLRGAVEFRGVRFAYRDGTSVIDGIDLRVAPGETVALVGPSGGGKTTLMKLVQRLYDPTSGTILVDGMDLRMLKQRAVRKQIGVVLQESGLFSDSIRENIAFGRANASEVEIERAARAANAHDFILALPDGYDTVIGDRGCRLSAGQAQRIAIARALLKDAPILVLDEATSALDAESESLVQEALERLSVGRTTFIIAHRLSTVIDADRIVVLDGGRIAEMGTHEELLRANGVYAGLVKKQRLGVLFDAA